MDLISSRPAGLDLGTARSRSNDWLRRTLSILSMISAASVAFALHCPAAVARDFGRLSDESRDAIASAWKRNFLDISFSASQWRPTTYDNDTFSLDGLNWYVSAEYAHSFQYTPVSDTYRFEVRAGDVISSTRYTDPSTSERSEISMANRYSLASIDNHFAIEYQFMVEPGPHNTAQWLVMGQLHSGLNRTPPFEISFRGDYKMQIVAKYGTGGWTETVLYKDSQDIVRGKWYTKKIDVGLGPSGDGHVHVWRDGQEIVDYTGRVGYGDQTSTLWNMGV